jgi:hypothetical protein
MTTNTTTTGRAQEAASTAADEGRHVAGVAKEEAQNVAATAADQARNLVSETMDQVTGQLGEQANGQRDRVVGTLQSLGDDLERMASQSGASGLASDLAREVADRARALGSHLDGRQPGELLEDVRSFARRRPGTFLLGALVAGVVTGRVVRAAADGTAAAGVAEDRRTPAVPPAVPATTTPTLTAPGTTPPTTPPSPAVTSEPTGSSGPGFAGGPTPTNPPMPPSTPGQQTMDAPGDPL